MEKFKELIQTANRAVKTADHLTYMTFPLVNDTKLLITIVENLHSAVINSMDALLYYDWLFKRISNLPLDFRSRLEIFKSYSIMRYNIPRDSVVLIQDIESIINHRRNSPMEFVRKGELVLCTNNYNMKTINFIKVKEYTNKAKDFVRKVNSILS